MPLLAAGKCQKKWRICGEISVKFHLDNSHAYIQLLKRRFQIVDISRGASSPSATLAKVSCESRETESATTAKKHDGTRVDSNYVARVAW